MISTLMIWVMIMGGFSVALIAFGAYDSSASEGAQLITELIMLLASLCAFVFMAIGLFKLVSFASSPNPDVAIGYRYEETIYEENNVVALKDSTFNYEKGTSVYPSYCTSCINYFKFFASVYWVVQYKYTSIRNIIWCCTYRIIVRM